MILIPLFNSTYHFTHLLIHSVWLQVWSDRKWIRYGCVLLLYILCVLWVLFYTLHFLYLVLFLSLSDNSSLVANVICLLKPTWNKVYLILSYLILSYLILEIDSHSTKIFTNYIASDIDRFTDTCCWNELVFRHIRQGSIKLNNYRFTERYFEPITRIEYDSAPRWYSSAILSLEPMDYFSKANGNPHCVQMSSTIK